MILCDNLHIGERISDNCWRIDEAGIANCYLIIGKSGALLIDTGCGAGNLLACTGQLTDKPVTVALTHRHPDHIGGAWEFGRYYASEDDFGHPYDFFCKDIFSRIVVRFHRLKTSLKRPSGQKTAAVMIPDGHIFDLGDRQVQAISTPGHTRGSMTFVDGRDKLLIAGDEVSPDLKMQRPGCTGFGTWFEGAEKILSFLDKGYRGWYGHGDGRLTKEQVQETIDLAHELEDRFEDGTLKKKRGIFPSASGRPSIRYRVANMAKP